MTKKETRTPTIDTRDRILRAASDLFATNGFNGTTLREITERAGANLAAVNYYFKTKDDLVISTIEEAVRPLVEVRMKALQTCLDTTRPCLPTVDQMADALVTPLLTFSNGENRNRLLLLMQVRSDPESAHSAVVMKHFKPLHEQFVTALKSVLPHLSKSEIAYRYDCARGATLQSLVELAPARKLVSMSASERTRLDISKNRQAALVRFVSAGFQAEAN
jgi:AcrR family transcriptional regulator